jgi:putative sterol carrier protein
VATVEDCEQALHTLADRMAAHGNRRVDDVERSLSCTLRDLGATFTGRLAQGRLQDIAAAAPGAIRAQIRLETSSDDLVALVAGKLPVGSALATGRLAVHAGVRDMLRLRSMF